MASIASMKLGSKSEVFQRQGQTWNCTTGLPSDIVVEIGEISFNLHKFPLLSRSGRLEKLIGEITSSNNGDGSSTCTLELHDLPGGAKSFELIAKFCYGVKLELNAQNVVGVRCAAEQLQMTEDYGESNLIVQAENFLQEILVSWKDSLLALKSCEEVLLHAEELQIVTRCINSLSTKACIDSTGFGWSIVGSELSSSSTSKSPTASSSDMWNGISTSSRTHLSATDWWYEDVSLLSLPLFKRFITEVGFRGMKPESVAGSLVFYAKCHLPGLSKGPSFRGNAFDSAPFYSENDQRILLEEIESMLPAKKGVTSTKLLFAFLRTAMILHARKQCRESLEKRIGAQLDDAALGNLLITNLGYSGDTLYDVECMQRILDHFMFVVKHSADVESSEIVAEEDQLIESSSTSSPIAMVARLMDGYLSEVASDPNLKFNIFHALASTIPDYARAIDDGLYRAIDIYLKAHPWLTDSEREQLCHLLNCQKLSLEACTHAAQNERLPLRMIVQVLFFEQLRLRTSIASWFSISDDLENSHAPPESLMLVNHKVESSRGSKEFSVNDMKLRVLELEKESSCMKHEIEKIGKTKSSWSILPKRFGLRLKPQPLCNGEEVSVDCHKSNSEIGALKMKSQQIQYLDH